MTSLQTLEMPQIPDGEGLQAGVLRLPFWDMTEVKGNSLTPPSGSKGVLATSVPF